MGITYILIAALVGLVVFIHTRPSEGRIERSVIIAAPASAIFPLVSNPKNFELWNPWAKIDPNAKGSFEGPPEGVGSIMRWDGNNQVGSGSMTCIESKPYDVIKFRMDFLKPMKNTQTAEFTFRQEGSNTVVTWAMYGPCNFAGKAINLLINCEKMVGAQFEKGLNDLRALVVAKVA